MNYNFQIYFTGSAPIWHGYADILLSQKIAVSVLPKPPTSDEETQSNDAATEDTEGPSASKRMCKNDQDSEDAKDTEKKPSNFTFCVEVKKNGIMDCSVSKQIIAQTITNAFAELNENKELSGWLIPTFGCTKDDLVVFLYDPKNDVLLQCESEIPIWVGNTLSLNAIIQVWMLLNFPIFTKKNLADNYEMEKSNFHNLVQKMLPLYWSINRHNNFTGKSSSIEETYKRMLRTCRLWAKEAKKKE